MGFRINEFTEKLSALSTENKKGFWRYILSRYRDYVIIWHIINRDTNSFSREDTEEAILRVGDQDSIEIYEHITDNNFISYALIMVNINENWKSSISADKRLSAICVEEKLKNIISKVNSRYNICDNYVNFDTLARGLTRKTFNSNRLWIDEFREELKMYSNEDIDEGGYFDEGYEDSFGGGDDGNYEHGQEDNDYVDKNEYDIDNDSTSSNFDDNDIFLNFDNDSVDVDNNEVEKASYIDEDESILNEKTVYDSSNIRPNDIDKSKIDIIASEKDDSGNEVDLADLSEDDNFEIEQLISKIVQKNEAVFRTCLELDRPHGMLYTKGEARYRIEKGKCYYTNGLGQNGNSYLERIYIALTKTSDMVCAADLRNVPNIENIINHDWSYYPGRMLDYSLGSVSGVPHKNWSSFESELRRDLKKRLTKLYKTNDIDGTNLFFKYQTKIEESFCNAILVLERDAASGMKIRLCDSGNNINTSIIDSSLRNLNTNAKISITKVQNCTDVIDIQIMSNEKSFLEKPSWAYEAMRVKINNGEKLDISEGIPIGRKVNGEIVNCTFRITEDFATFIAAGSGAGKGVLTLSLLCAFLGNNIPVFYTDYKPDMAAIFWKAEKELGVPIFSYDAMVKSRVHSPTPEKHTRGFGLPKSISGELSQYSGALMYLKLLQLMCAMASWGQEHEYGKPLMFVFDEIQAIQRVIQAMIKKISSLLNSKSPEKGKGASDDYKYLLALSDWIKNVDDSFSLYLTTTGRTSGVFSIFIGQNPNINIWSNMKTQLPGYTINGRSTNEKPSLIEIFSRITSTATLKKIIGRGAANSQYGLSNANADNEYKTNLKYVNSHRFFGMYGANTTSGTNVEFFKPFLTLNTDDIFDKCWTKGIGVSLGYGSVSNDQYIKNVAKVHPGNNKYGVHSGTGFLGLASMYMGEDINKLKEAIGESYTMANKFLMDTGLNSIYNRIEDYIYDCSMDGLLRSNQMLEFGNIPLNSDLYGVKRTINKVNSTSDNFYVDSGIDISNNINNNKRIIIDDGEDGDSRSSGSDYYTDLQGTSYESRYNNQNDNSEENKFDYENDGDKALERAQRLRQVISENKDWSWLSDKDIITKDDIVDRYDDENTGDTNFHIDEEIKRMKPMSGFNDNNPNMIVTHDVKNTIDLDPKNSIDCTLRPRITMNLAEKIFDRFKVGPAVYAKKLWNEILCCCADRIRADMVRSVAIIGDNIYVNRKLINVNGLIGGVDNVRLRDVINFKALFKKFRYLDDMCVDVDAETEWLYELKSTTLQSAFIEYKRLRRILIVDGDKKHTLIPNGNRNERRETEAAKRHEYDKEIKKVKTTSIIDRWGNATKGQKVWGVKSASKLINYSGDAIGNKGKWVRGVGAFALGASLGLVGALSWFGFTVLKMPFSRNK